MRRFIAGLLFLAGLSLPAAVPAQPAGPARSATADAEALRRTREGLGAAFLRGDVAGVMAYHHPDIRKALAYDRVVVGADAVAKDLAAGFAHARIEFIEDQIEDLVFNGDTAVQQARFAVRVTPRDGGMPTVFRGRSQVVWIRYAGSPSGWAALREMVQPMP